MIVLILLPSQALSAARTKDYQMQVERANRKAHVANAAAESRRQFLRYVFHEIRVPFNS